MAEKTDKGSDSSASSKIVPSNRFHEDLISVAEFIIGDFFQTHTEDSALTQAQRLELLESTLPSDAYEAALRADIPALHGPSNSTLLLLPLGEFDGDNWQHGRHRPLLTFFPSSHRSAPAKVRTGFRPSTTLAAAYTKAAAPHATPTNL